MSSKNLIPKLGERLKLARKMKRLSQQELADLVGISKMSISKYETGKVVPSEIVLWKLKEALDVKLEFLLRQPPEIKLTLAEWHQSGRCKNGKIQSTNHR